MELRSPLPLQDPWSPVGYRVVQVTDEQDPVVEVGPQPSRSGEGPQRPPPRAPSSPLGYRVTKVADENVPVATPAPRRQDRTAQAPAYSRSELRVIGSCLAAGGGVLVILFLGLLFSAQAADRERPEPDVIAAEPAIPEVNFAGPNLVIPPADGDAEPVRHVAKKDAAAKDPMPNVAAEKACDAVKGDDLPGGRETFGTAVSFARNPVEALHSAGRERKLAFVLHVSGNFEEARFT